MIRLTIATLLSFTVFVLGHWLHFHFGNPYDRVNSVMGAALLGLGLMFVIYRFLPSESSLLTKLGLANSPVVKFLPLLVASLLYALLFVGYLEFYFTADRSITFRMLRMTDENPNSSVTAEEMLKMYDTKSIVLRRFDDMVYGGYMYKDGDQYRLTPKGNRVLAVYRRTIDFLHMPKF